jgi:hypothetical protein
LWWPAAAGHRPGSAPGSQRWSMRAAAADCRARKDCIRPEPGRPPGPTGRIAWSLFLPLFKVPGAVFPWCNKHRYLGPLIDWAILGHETSQERLTNARVPSRCRVSARLGRGAVFWVGVRTGAGMGVRVLVRRGPVGVVVGLELPLWRKALRFSALRLRVAVIGSPCRHLDGTIKSRPFSSAWS